MDVRYSNCPLEITVHLIGNKWKPIIVHHLLSGTKRFSELRRSIPDVSQKVLTDNLRSMEEDGLITREIFAEVPTRVEYTLTDVGNQLVPVIEAMQLWGDGYKKLAETTHSTVEAEDFCEQSNAET